MLYKAPHLHVCRLRSKRGGIVYALQVVVGGAMVRAGVAAREQPHEMRGRSARLRELPFKLGRGHACINRGARSVQMPPARRLRYRAQQCVRQVISDRARQGCCCEPALRSASQVRHQYGLTAGLQRRRAPLRVHGVACGSIVSLQAAGIVCVAAGTCLDAASQDCAARSALHGRLASSGVVDFVLLCAHCYLLVSSPTTPRAHEAPNYTA